MSRRRPPATAPARPQAPVSKAEFARICGRSRSSITEACGEGGALREALVADRIDLNSNAALQYRLRALGRHPTVREFAEVVGVPVEQVYQDIPEAIIPGDQFAECEAPL